MVLAPFFPAIRGIGAGILTPSQGSRQRAIDSGTRPVDRVGSLEFLQKHRVQLVPEAKFSPLLQAFAAGAAGAASPFAGQVIPAEAGTQDEQDSGERLAVGQRLASREAETPGLGRWQQRLDTLPQGIG